MKTIKTANGIKKIEDWNLGFLPVQLRAILQEHRASLIDRLITGGIETYIEYKFNTRVMPKKIQNIKLNLENLKNSGIDSDRYKSIFDAVSKNEFTNLNNSIFYAEIDLNIKGYVFEPQLFFKEGRQVFLQ